MISLRFVLVVGLVAVSSPALAQKRAVVLPVELGGFFPKRATWKSEYSLALEERLKGARFVVIKPELTQAQAECHEAACLAAIANAHNVDVVVSGRVNNDEQRLTSYHVRVRVLERVAPGATPAIRERERSCTNCTEVTARSLLATTLSAALVDEPEPSPEAKPSPSPAPVPPVAQENPPVPAPPSGGWVSTSPPPPAERFTRKQKLIFRSTGIASGVLGLAFVAQGFVELHHQGDPVDKAGKGGCVPDCGYHLNTTSGQAVFFSLGIAGVAASAALLTLGWKHWPSKRVTIAPDVSPAGARLQLGGSF